MRLAFDYTGEAGPITIARLKRDVDDYYVRMMLTPDKIIVWEHQFDWLLKALGGAEKAAPHLAAGIRIWSIPLEVRKP